MLQPSTGDPRSSRAFSRHIPGADRSYISSAANSRSMVAGRGEPGDRSCGEPAAHYRVVAAVRLAYAIIVSGALVQTSA